MAPFCCWGQSQTSPKSRVRQAWAGSVYQAHQGSGGRAGDYLALHWFVDQPSNWQSTKQIRRQNIPSFLWVLSSRVFTGTGSAARPADSPHMSAVIRKPSAPGARACGECPLQGQGEFPWDGGFKDAWETFVTRPSAEALLCCNRVITSSMVICSSYICL